MFRHASRWLGAVVLLSLIGCAADEPAADLATLTARLDGCPRGDIPWYDAVRAAAASDDAENALESLLRRTESLVEICSDRWEPIWAGAECLYRLRPLESSAGFERATERARALDEPSGVARATNRLALLDYRAGRLTEGEARFVEALAAAESAERPDLEAFVLNNYAGLLLEMGRFAEARDRLETAAQGLEQLGLVDAARAARFNRGVIHLELGDAVAAREILESVRREAQAAGDDETVHEASLNLGNLHLAVGELAAADTDLERALAGAPDVAALAELGLGRLALMREDTAGATRRLAAAADAARSQERLFALIAETLLAEAERRAKRTESARDRLLDVIEESDAIDAEESAWVGRQVLGKLLLDEGEIDDAIRVLEAALEIVETQRDELDPQGSGVYFLRERADLYADLAVAVARGGGPDRDRRVLAIAHRAQARALQQASGTLPSNDGPAGSSARLDSIQRGLRSGERMIDYLLGDDHGVALVIGPEGSTVATIAGRRALGDDLAVFADWVRRPEAGPMPDAGHRLGRTLIDAVLDDPSSIHRLYVVPDRELALLPFAALPGVRDETYLGDTVEIATMPLAAPPPRWESGDSDVRGPVLLAGVPSLAGTDFPELPWAAYELSHLDEIWGDAVALQVQGADLTRERLLAELTRNGDRFGTIHLATHAVASTRDPRRCGVILSGGERIGLDDIAGGALSLRDDALVTLAACRTGVGELVPGQGVIGLGWSFMLAGAQAVVASHWTVPDDTAARLMVSFHRGLAAGEDPVGALADASRALGRESTRLRHPAYWAPFSIQLRP